MYIGQDAVELTKHLGRQQVNRQMSASSGMITSVDPVKYAAKVMLQPLGVETGWLPIGTLYVGAGFGLWALPDIDTEVLVVFEQGNLNVGKIILSNWNDTDAPPSGLQPGQLVLTHKTGSLLKFDTDGSVSLNPNTILSLAGGGAALARVGDAVQVNVGGTVYTGTITNGSSKVQSG